jgi:hypothetical protein
MQKAILALVLCFATMPASSATKEWQFVPVDPPVTLPDLMADGGRLVNVSVVRAEETGDRFGLFFIELKGKVFRCITVNTIGQPCAVAKSY